jgi:hypothetical protein
VHVVEDEERSSGGNYEQPLSGYGGGRGGDDDGDSSLSCSFLSDGRGPIPFSSAA